MLDQFYTKPEAATHCIQAFRSVADSIGVDLEASTWIEPSAGCGRFYSEFPPKRIGIDLDPRIDGVIKQDFLEWRPPDGKFVVLGNPPFGVRGATALAFIRKAAQFADMIGFIVPQFFNSDGKGAPSKRLPVGLTLAHSEPLPPDSFEFPDGRETDVWTLFQVWTAVNGSRVKPPRRSTCSDWLSVYSLSDGGSPSTTRNKRMIGKCDVYLPSTCFSGMRAYDSFDDLPNGRGYGVEIHADRKAIKETLIGADWPSIAFRSTNGALNLRRSMIEGVVVESGYADGSLI